MQLPRALIERGIKINGGLKWNEKKQVTMTDEWLKKVKRIWWSS